MGTSHEGLRTYYCCQRHQFASTALLQNTEFFFYNVGSDKCYATMNIHFMYCVSVHAENMECPILFPFVYTVCLFVCLLYIQSIHTWSKPQDIEFVIINYIR